MTAAQQKNLQNGPDLARDTLTLTARTQKDRPAQFGIWVSTRLSCISRTLQGAEPRILGNPLCIHAVPASVAQYPTALSIVDARAPVFKLYAKRITVAGENLEDLLHADPFSKLERNLI